MNNSVELVRKNDHRCGGCGQSMPLPEKGGEHCTNCGRFQPKLIVPPPVDHPQISKFVQCKRCRAILPGSDKYCRCCGYPL